VRALPAALWTVTGTTLPLYWRGASNPIHHSPEDQLRKSRSAVSEAAERWLPVVGYEGLYAVSDMGRVMSLPRIKSGGRGRTRIRFGRVLRPLSRNKDGYLSVSLYRNGSQAHQYIHRLVLLAFIGPAPAGTECCHGNGNPADNRLSNLRWDTHAANAQDAIRHRSRRKRAA
jgi:hypothetical protein